MRMDGSGYQNPWYWLLVLLAAGALAAGLVMSVQPVGPYRTAAFWLALPFPLLMLVGVVGWAYSEIRHYEAMHPEKSARQRILGYFGVLLVVAAIAVGGALTPTRDAPIVAAALISVGLVGGWLRRRMQRRR